VPFNAAAQNLMLDALDESLAAGIKYVGIHTLAGGDPGVGTNAAGTEATGGSPAYARQAVTFGSAASGQKSNTGALTFDVPAGTYAFLTFFNDVSANSGNYRGFTPMGGAAAVKGFFSVDTTLTNDQFLSVAHGLADGDRVQLYGAFAETLPTGTGLSEGAVLFVVSSAANTFKLSTTSGGAAIDLTATGGGEGYFQKVVPETFNAQGQLTVAIGALVLDATAI
jgi:hypothetical protein